MGFASGSYSADNIWKKIRKFVPAKDHQKVAEIIVQEFENLDSDDWSYAKGDVYQVARPKEVEEMEDDA